MALLTLEATGPNGEELAIAAGDALGVPVGWDSEFECATFDSSDMDDDELMESVSEALAGIDPGWRTQLQVVVD